jgi:oxygen-independent coproporphyrinogen III oxidase
VPARHLYVHVPFCARRCSYCDFSIAVRASTPVEEYLTALRQEMDGLHASQPRPLGEEFEPGSLHAGGPERVYRGDLEGLTLDTVYLGGGTPSRLGGLGVRDVLTAVRGHATISDDAEVTIEANPDDVNDMAVAHWVAAGVNRVSLGSQSFDEGALKWMHRTHDSAQIGHAVRALRRGGIDNISLDLIFALPAHLQRSWESDLVRALDLEPAHVSLYGLTVEAQTPLARWADRGAIVQGTEDSYEEEFLTADTMMTAAGFEHYEVSNFARSGRVSRHNSAYWTGAAYVGIGPSAHSFDGVTRRWNVSAYSEWIRRLGKGESVISGAESLTDENRTLEEVYLGLRTQRGLAVTDDELSRLRPWVSAGWAFIEDSESSGPALPAPRYPLPAPRYPSAASRRLRLTPTGWLRLDSLAANLAAHRARSTTATLGPTPSHCYI